MTTLFVSDLHLCARRPETVELFLHLLAGPARDAGALYILGDLFDYWAGDDDLGDPFNRRIADALTALATPKFFLPGNRDFLIGAQFGVLDLAGQPTLLLHGDTLCTDDLDYQAARKVLRSAEWRRDLLALPLAERKRKIEGLREQSETAKGGKSHEIMDANADAVAEAFRERDVTRMIHGHTHRQARHEHLVDGRSCERWVLGDWGAQGNALAVDSSGCRWLTIERG